MACVYIYIYINKSYFIVKRQIVVNSSIRQQNKILKNRFNKPHTGPTVRTINLSLLVLASNVIFLNFQKINFKQIFDWSLHCCCFCCYYYYYYYYNNNNNNNNFETKNEQRSYEVKVEIFKLKKNKMAKGR